jgi:hypothetical protein
VGKIDKSRKMLKIVGIIETYLVRLVSETQIQIVFIEKSKGGI